LDRVLEEVSQLPGLWGVDVAQTTAFVNFPDAGGVRNLRGVDVTAHSMRDPRSHDAIVGAIVRLVLARRPSTQADDFLRVDIDYGFDFGIAGWRSRHIVNYPPAEWTHLPGCTTTRGTTLESPPSASALGVASRRRAFGIGVCRTTRLKTSRVRAA
jgi:hypothetical protein